MLTESLSGELERTFYARCPNEKRPKAYRDGPDGESNPNTRVPTPQPVMESSRSHTINEDQSEEKFGSESPDLEKAEHVDDEKLNKGPQNSNKGPQSEKKGQKQSKQDSSLLRALHVVFFWDWWISGGLKLASGEQSKLQLSCVVAKFKQFADTLKTTTPLISKLLLTWLTNSFIFYKAGPVEAAALGVDQPPRGIGYGIGLAFALFIMQGNVTTLVSFPSRIN